MTREAYMPNITPGVYNNNTEFNFAWHGSYEVFVRDVR